MLPSFVWNLHWRPCPDGYEVYVIPYDWSLSLSTAWVWILLKACEEVACDLGLSGCFTCVLWLPQQQPDYGRKSEDKWLMNFLASFKNCIFVALEKSSNLDQQNLNRATKM